MPIDVFGNSAQTPLTVAVTTAPAAGTSETWTVQSTAAPFPQLAAGQQFRCVVSPPAPNQDANPEIIFVTATASATTFTVTRGAEGSAVKTHAAGDVLYHIVTAGFLNEVQSSMSSAVLLDATSTDIQGLLSAAEAGSTGKAADAGHVHPLEMLIAMGNTDGRTGTVPSGATMLLKASTTVVSTGSAGDWSFSLGFPNGVAAVVVMNGDDNALAGGLMSLTNVTVTALSGGVNSTDVSGRAYQGTNPAVNATIRIDFIAVGW